MPSIQLTTTMKYDPQHVYDAVLDIEGQAEFMDHMQSVEILSSTDDEQVVRMHERVDGEDVIVTSRFRFEKPNWVTYEHVESPFGENSGRFDVIALEDGCELRQTHTTAIDLDERASLRDEWKKMMGEIHETIAILAARAD